MLFFVLAMRTINHEPDLAAFGNKELEQLLDYYGEVQVQYVLSHDLTYKIKIENIMIRFIYSNIGTIVIFQVHKNKMSQPLVSKDKVREQWRAAKLIAHSARYPLDDMTNF